LREKTVREIMLKKTWDSASLRKDRKEDFRSEVLKNCKGVRP
jgi:hypothetical protein